MEQEIIFSVLGKKERLVDRVVHETQRLISEGKLKPGMHIPPERLFADQLGVSRTVVREAVQILIAKGLLETRHGVGTVVRQFGSNQLIEPLDMLLKTHGFTLDHLHYVRSILEIDIAGSAAAQATAEDIDRLSRIVARMEVVWNDPEAYTEADTEFHVVLASTLHNPLMDMLLNSIGELIRGVRISVARHPELYMAGLPDHRRILERVIEHDGEGAREAMGEHLKRAREIQNRLIEEEEARKKAQDLNAEISENISP